MQVECMFVYAYVCMYVVWMCVYVFMCGGVWFSKSSLLTYNNDSYILFFLIECGMFPWARVFEHLVVPF